MTSASDSSSKKRRWEHTALVECVVLPAACLAVACATPLSAPEQKIDTAPNDGALAGGRRIAPPPGMSQEKSRNTRNAVDKLIAEMPEEARNADGDVVLPLETQEDAPRRSSDEQRRREARAARTDNEIVGSQRSLDERQAKELGGIERALGVESEEGGTSAPSYVLTVQRIKDLFKAKEYEDALIESNEALRHYPKSAQILSMKGTLHQRLQQVELALASYERAFEIEPTRKLRAQIDYLRSVIADRASLQRYRDGVVIPGEAAVSPKQAKGGE